MATAIRLDGAVNFRDFGGCPAGTGRRIRTGLLFRSARLSDLTAGDFRALDEIGVRTICDLRGERERERLPTRPPENWSAGFLHLDVQEDPGTGAAAFWARIAADPSEAGVRRAMTDNYRRMPARFSRALPQLFDRLLDPGGAPIVVHCHAGKDRTGFACAMTLYALGADRRSVRADYLRTRAAADAIASQSLIAEAAARRLGFRLEARACAMIEAVRSEYLDAALQTVRADHGSIRAYLERVGGLDDRKRQQLRDRFTVRSAPAEAGC